MYCVDYSAHIYQTIEIQDQTHPTFPSLRLNVMPLKINKDPMIIIYHRDRCGDMTSQPETKDCEACNCAELFLQSFST